MLTLDQILSFKNQALALISQMEKSADLKQLRQEYLGRKGQINSLVKQLAHLESGQKSNLGRAVNEAKSAITQSLDHKLLAISHTPDWLDVTQPGTQPPVGHLHPITQAINEITRIFEHLGFTRVRYPEVDWDYYTFEALNMPPGHPARDEWETFFIAAPAHPRLGQLVLTPHTSNGQVREMERVKTPPIRMINIAKCYRRQQDLTHTSMFHQFECLVIDKGINIQHFKATIDYFARHFYGPKAKSRLRPFHFQFTEPSFEVDFTCSLCHGQGCKFCKSGWHEVAGAGMVHPNVLKAGGIDPNQYTGFAFGMGVERAYTLKPRLQLDDIRYFYSNNLDFLSQF
ncbi:MAG: phenylalanine--tRNA ligase subunit alpha [Candidatus Chisholmbacteria bacterium RIFCSPHIGHO2_01_FULL_48_12]|uniref:Phenylalanine--tRNA ligase alpha subunit n=1 Tax=Candidatus Chisholmbacteria bacterium RIFCSPHIGHO2_01_FULL_48_12 TaxID=1797589 RepID=A0A1G1VJN6_9BACT|nr:MAG: phenylalanine--tRNA ligase subunit alpha [Candidatus Chisholmbacteria bacterium RIFCSPHIGHO2_01_FULL_48_12]